MGYEIDKELGNCTMYNIGNIVLNEGVSLVGDYQKLTRIKTPEELFRLDKGAMYAGQVRKAKYLRINIKIKVKFNRDTKEG